MTTAIERTDIHGGLTGEPGFQAVSVLTVRDESAFGKMREEWNGLLEAFSGQTVFLTWDWLWSWWQAYGTAKELCILRVERGRELIGIAPFYNHTMKGPLGVTYRAFSLLGDGSADSDYLDLISSRGNERIVVSAVMEWLQEQAGAWSMLHLNEIPDSSPHLPHILSCARERAWRWTEAVVPCACIDLPKNWDSYLASLGSRMRTKVRSLVRRLDESHTVECGYAFGGAEVGEKLAALFDLHQQRWEAEGSTGVFGSKEKRRFYMLVAERFLVNGWLRLYSLRVDGQCVAQQFCFEHRGGLSLLQEGYDPNWAEHSVGNVLRAYVIRDCIERGVRTYDFLGGVTFHKLSWGATRKNSVRLAIAGKGIRGAMLYWIPRMRDAIKRCIKANLPVFLVERLKGLRISRRA